MVHAVVVVAELRELAFGLVVGDQAGVVADDSHLRVANRREAVGDHRQARHAKRHGAQRRIVVQRHLDPLVGILVVHVVDDVHGIDINPGEPVHHLFELVQHVIEVEVVALRPRRLSGPTCLPVISSRPPLIA